MGEAHSDRTKGTNLSTTTTYATTPYPYDVASSTRCLTADDIVAAGTTDYGVTGLSNIYPYDVLKPWGVRQVDGQCNNITQDSQTKWGSADQTFPRIAPRADTTNTATYPVLNPTQIAYSDPAANVSDPSPRMISNLISDQTANNPAATAAANLAATTLYGAAAVPVHDFSVNVGNNRVTDVLEIPNITPDYNVSAGYDSWFTEFGQFFDHGLDLIPKSGATVIIPIDQTDGLYVPGSNTNFMTLKRSGNSTSGDSSNSTTPYIDQSQTYGSHASQNFFVREYSFIGASTNLIPTSTGRLLDGTDSPYVTNFTAGSTMSPSNGGKPTWRDIKHQSLLFGFNLSDYDVGNIPFIATDQYGKFIPGPSGRPMMLFTDGLNYRWVEGSNTAPVSTSFVDATVTWTAVKTGHAFLNDITSSASPFSAISGAPLTADGDNVVNSAYTTPTMTVGGDFQFYDNEALDMHFIAGDGRINENIGLASIHQVFASEHNLLVTDMKNQITADGSPEFISEWFNNSTWNGERLYQAARMIMENEYQHMAYDEFVRRIAPQLPAFAAYDNTIDPSVTAEFASAVYRLGHSMLGESLPRSNPGGMYDATNNQDVSLIGGFINPMAYRYSRPAIVNSASYSRNIVLATTTYTYTLAAGEAVPAVGKVVSVSGLTDPTFNMENLVVSGVAGQTFSATQKYLGNSTVGSVALVGDIAPIPFLPTAATATGTTLTFTGANSFRAGQTVTISSCLATPGVSSRFNLANVVISSATASSISIASNVAAGTATGCSILAQTTTASLKVAVGGANIARVTINDDKNSPQLNQTYTTGQAAAILAQGLTAQRGNEVDEFVTDSVRNNLLGMPLDLAVLNITRGRDVALPTLNQFRSAITTSNKATLKPYISWTDYIANLRYIESGINFMAAYGTHPTITTKRILGTAVNQSVVGASGAGSNRTYTGITTTGLNVGDVVSFSNFSNGAFNISNAVIDSFPTPTSISVSTHFVTDPGIAVVADAQGSRPAAIAIDAFIGATGVSGFATRATTQAERRAAATALNTAAATAGTDAANFMNSANATATGCVYPDGSTTCINWSTTETGLNNVDLWIGGLAENPAKQPVIPPMFGSTFQFVFMDQMLKLQNGDRFYYLGRLAGMNIGEEIPAQKFTDIVKRNTPAVPAVTGQGLTLALPSPGFSVVDCYFAAGTIGASIPVGARCPAANITNPTPTSVIRNIPLDNAGGFADPTSSAGFTITAGGGDDMVLGTLGNDTLSGGPSGGDLIDGGAGDDVILGLFGEDLLKGGQGNDVINSGDSQLGDIADGGAGSDFIHSSNNLGLDNFLGESGNDFIQAGAGSDILVFGGEGSDWIEGGADIDGLNGDSGLNGGGGDTLKGGNDVINGQAGNDIVNAGGGDDILLAGDGIDLLTAGTGFDWVNYEYANRNAYVDFSGSAQTTPPIADGFFDFEAISGSPRADDFYASQSTDHSVTGVVGTKGLRALLLSSADIKIEMGMLVSGPGIAPHTQVIAISKNLQVVDLDTDLTGNITNGTIKFSTDPLRDTALITGLSAIVTGTPGYNKTITATGVLSTSLTTRNGIVNGNFFKLTSGSDTTITAGAVVTFSGTAQVATVTSNYGNVIALNFAGAVAPPATYTATFTPVTQWSGGNIILGGDGADKFTLTGGSNIVDGKSYLHTCISANAGVFTNFADVNCGSSTGYSSMSKLAVPLENRTLNPSQLSIVREIVDGLDTVSPDTVYYLLDSSNYAVETVTGLTSLGNQIYRVTGPDGNIDILRNIDVIVFKNTSCLIAAALTGCSGIAAPNTPVISAVTQNSATVTFTYTGLVVPTSFSVTSSPSATGCPNISVSASYTCTFTGLTSGTLYTFFVNAKKGLITSSASSASVTTAGASGGTPSGGGGGGGGFAMPAPIARVAPTIDWNITSEISDETEIGDSNVFTAKISTPAALSGNFYYNVLPGSHLSLGIQSLTVSFIPKDQTAYDAVTKTIQVTVVPSSKKVSLNVSSGPFVYDGSSKEASVSTSLASSAYRITYNGSDVAPKEVGTYNVEVTPTGTPARFDAVKTTLTIAKAKPVITWKAVKTLRNGVALTAQHLNASASTAGKFIYSTKLGTVLPEGINGILVKFVPADSKNFESVSTAAQIEVGLAVDTLMVLPDTYLFDPSQMDSMSAMFTGVKSVSIVGYTKATGKKSADITTALARSNALKAQLSALFPDIAFKAKSGGGTRVAACSKIQNQCLLVKVTG